MNTYASECARGFCATSFLRRGIIFLAFACTAALHAQLTTVSQTYSVPHLVDGSAFSVFFDLSAQLSTPTASLTNTTLSLHFTKEPDLSDDPAFYSEMGFVLRKLDTHFAVVKEVTLVELGSFNDGQPFSFFDGEITFSDSAADVVNVDPDQPSSGLFRGEQPLALFNGSYSPYWELRLVDASYQNPLIFESATLTLDAFVPRANIVPVPEPAAVGLCGASLLVALVARRRRVVSVS